MRKQEFEGDPAPAGEVHASAGDPFDAPGEMAARGRQMNWAATPLGAVDTWSPTLRATVRTCLESPFPINLWCGPQLVLIYNDAYRLVLGGKHPRALGRPGSEVWAEIWRDIAPMFSQIRAGGPAVYADDAPFVVQRADTSADAELAEPNAWFTFSLSPVRDEDGEIVAFLNIVSESTGRVLAERAREVARANAERAEARLRDVFAQAPAFMAVMRGPEHVFEYVNDAYYDVVGRRDLIGRPVFDALPETRGQGFEELLDGVLKTGVPFVGRELPLIVSRGGDEREERFVDFVYYPITEADGTRSGVVAHGSDVTDHVLARREAQRASAEAEQANQAKSQFLANMSHEIRTPINAVMGYADLLDAQVAGPLEDRQQEYVRRIRTSSEHLLDLVEDVLDLAKVEAGEMTVQMEPVALEPVARSGLQMISPQAEARGVELEEEWECDESERFLGDEHRVRQVLLNLLSNALKFTGRGGRVTVRCRKVEAPPPEIGSPESGPWVVVEVEDTGSGIPAEQLSRIFDPFVQADSGHTRRSSGTGLGLTISREFALLMGGGLTVTSELDVGSRFCLWLTAADQQPDLPASGSWPRAEETPARQIAGLGSLGQSLQLATKGLEDELVARLRAEPDLPGGREVNRAQLADHIAAYLTVLAKSMIGLDEGGAEPALLQDGEDIQDLMASRHGRQRRRLGWPRELLRREFQILHDLLDAFLRREAPRRTTMEIEGALGVVHRLLDRAELATLAAYDASADGIGGAGPGEV